MPWFVFPIQLNDQEGNRDKVCFGMSCLFCKSIILIRIELKKKKRCIWETNIKNKRKREGHRKQKQC